MEPARRKRWRGVALRLFTSFTVVIGILVDTAVEAAELQRVSCDYVCKEGACAYTSCSNGPSCPGGTCSFDNCFDPSCTGGNCDFLSCHNPVCRGGNCRFVDPQTTLRDGYCDGGVCVVNGRPFPSRFAGKLTI